MNPNAFHISRTVAIVLVLGLVVLAAVGYTLMQKPDDDVVSITGATSESEATFITLATELDAITFDTSIFSDPRFTVLQNIHTAITPEPQGRPDPFSSF